MKASPVYRWSTRGGYECSSEGDNRFSALFAKMPDGRTIEEWYQCDVKGYDPGGNNWRLGKRKPPLILYPRNELYVAYKTLWKIWAFNNTEKMQDLHEKSKRYDHLLSDCFGATDINQARALAEIFNENPNLKKKK